MGKGGFPSLAMLPPAVPALPFLLADLYCPFARGGGGAGSRGTSPSGRFPGGEGMGAACPPAAGVPRAWHPRGRAPLGALGSSLPKRWRWKSVIQGSVSGLIRVSPACSFRHACLIGQAVCHSAGANKRVQRECGVAVTGGRREPG